jgi:hypothetical protein
MHVTKYFLRTEPGASTDFTTKQPLKKSINEWGSKWVSNELWDSEHSFGGFL